MEQDFRGRARRNTRWRGGYQGPEFQAGLKKAIARVNVEIVKRSDQAKGFVVLPGRRVVERTPGQARGRLFAWLGRCRRLAEDRECRNAKGPAFVKLAAIRRMIRRLCNPS